jgi:thiol-disulfide isomerase/thioredoxin
MTRALAVLGLLATSVFADDKPKSDSPAEKLATLQKQQTEAETTYYQTSQALPDTPEGVKKDAELWTAFSEGQEKRYRAAIEIAKADPKSEIGFAALNWLLRNPGSYYQPTGLTGLAMVREHHATNPKIGTILAQFIYNMPPERWSPKEHAACKALIIAVRDKNPNKTARAQAHLALAYDASRVFSVAEYQRSANVDQLAAVAEKQYEALLQDYGECPFLRSPRSGTVGEFAKSELFELRHLRYGQIAPEIEAEGVDGATFKLSDFRGKITVLVFWASWCGPCMRQVPHERKLVERLKGKPFALVGVNGDEDQAKAKETMSKEKMVWPSFWDGPKSSISKAWNLRGWPTIYVLDTKGVIRFKGVRGEELDKAVDELLKELQDKK